MANPKFPALNAIGFMSGTSLDGVDVALIRSDGEDILAYYEGLTRPYSPQERAVLQCAIEAALEWNWQGEAPEAEVRAAQTVLHNAHLEAYQAYMVQYPDISVDVIGMHGQTLLHRAPDGDQYGQSWQIGDGQKLARALSIPVIYDFRSDDMAAGGQGAPLAPVYHAALVCENSIGWPLAVLNLGGVGNISWVDKSGQMMAFDTGPANGPVDQWVAQLGYGDYDENGDLAAKGMVDKERLKVWLSHPFFAAKPPKSLDRYDFTAALASGLSLQDGAASLTALSAKAVAKALTHLPECPKALIVCGGGRKNSYIMEKLAEYCAIPVLCAEDMGWHGDALEAQLFGFLAIRHLYNLPISFPSTTGVSTPLSGGKRA